MTRRKPLHRLVFWTSLTLATLAGCDKDSPTETVTIYIGGQCRAAASTIVCRDASRSEPQKRLTIVDWELISGSTGLTQGVLPSAPGGEVSFPGLATGTYQVNQKVSARDGSEQERTYGPFTVSPPLALERPGMRSDTFAREDSLRSQRMIGP